MTARETTLPSGEGFTLVEMLMAMLIMTVGLLGLLQSVSVAYRQSLADRLRQEAVLVAEEHMHDWQRLEFKNVTASGRSTVDRNMAGSTRQFTVEREQREMGSSVKTSRRLRVAVRWDIRGQAVSHEIFAVKTR